MPKQRRPRKPKEVVEEVARHIRLGESDSEIARALHLHRTTVARYRVRSEGEEVARTARVQVIQEALARHFEDLCQQVERLRKEIVSPPPEYAAIEDLEASGPHSIRHLNTKVSVHWQTRDDGSVELCVPAEEELLLHSLKQHTRKSALWELFARWKGWGGSYLSHLSRLWRQIRGESEDRTRLSIDSPAGGARLTWHFPRTIYLDASGHAFSGYKLSAVAPCEIQTPRPGWFELWQGGVRLAESPVAGDMERCRRVYQGLMKRHQTPEEMAPDLRSAVGARQELQQLETNIAVELEKLSLRRTFPGKCDLCPE